MTQKEIIKELKNCGTIIEYGDEEHLLLLSDLQNISRFNIWGYHKIKSKNKIEFRLGYDSKQSSFRLRVVPMVGPYDELALINEYGSIEDLISLTESTWEREKLTLLPLKDYMISNSVVARYYGGVYVAIILPPIGKIISSTKFYNMIRYFESISPDWEWRGEGEE